MMYGSRRDDDSGAWGKLNDQSNIEEHEVAALGWIIGSTCKDCTEAIGNICAINMIQSHYMGTAVECASREYTALKGFVQLGALAEESLEVLIVVLVQFWGIEGKAT
jgi:hypothetical protein